MARGRGRAWTAEEDELIRAAAAATQDAGPTSARLADVAGRIGRTAAAVRKRAQRIAAVSYARVEWRREWNRRNRRNAGGPDGADETGAR